jgi:type IV fimbrial biogenesis protein FimT
MEIEAPTGGMAIALRMPVALSPRHWLGRRFDVGRPRTSLVLGRGRRGFTLIELLAVVAFIGIIAAAASPSLVKALRDRRVENAANSIAELFRIARTRSMGRGSAVLVRWNANAAIPSDAVSAAHFTVREAISGPTGIAAELPSTSCFGTDWGDAGVTSKFVMAFDDRRTRYEPAETRFLNPTGAPQTYAEICFTPRGRSFIRYSAAGAFDTLGGVPRIEVKNGTTGLLRFVVVPPHGAARVVSEL